MVWGGNVAHHRDGRVAKVLRSIGGTAVGAYTLSMGLGEAAGPQGFDGSTFKRLSLPKTLVRAW